LADFKTALEALAKGELKLETLSKQLDILLSKSPKFANKMLVQLDEIHDQKNLDDKQYAHLKRQINEFRRTHAAETEGGPESGGVDSTVFASDSVVENKDSGTDSGKQASPDSTVVMSDEEKATTTNGTATDSSDFIDISVPGSDTSTPSITSATGPTGTEWNDPAVPVGDLSGGYGVGSVIKQRFKLEKVLGIGGMGKVYMALDLLKAEAKDKKPHVAIKLLNDDFKDHPEAFISLQRESSRQQKLAHPNIATIYDFDRVGGPNTPVYITMELMEGMELKDFIKKQVRPKGGIPFDEAYAIIKQLGAGLIYAHDRRLVHSDFKPGNAFYCNDGIVKTLDFGIARAVKNPVTGEAEKTLFDPGKLGALTPAYASLEMLEGEEPDTRDDTYALGCTCYELLTGKHPFNKLPANKAKENNLVPPYIKKLNKKQNRALRRSVAFHREDRSPNVAHFLDELEGKATWHKNPFVIAAAVLLVIGMMLIAPALDYLHQKELEGMVVEINSGSEQVIIAKLDEILLLEKADQATVTDEAKEAIQNYFSDKVAGLIDTSGDAYDFPAAAKAIEEIGQFYPDSIFLQDQTGLVSKSKKQIIGDLNAQYIAALKDPNLIDNTNNILDTIRRIEPGHSLLTDPRPSNAYRLLALDRFEANEFDAALELVKSGMATAKDDPRLTDLETKILRAQKVAQFESELSIVQGQLSSLTDYKEQETTIVELANLKPDSEVIASLSESFKPIFEEEFKTIKSGTQGDADAFASEFEKLMNGLQLNQQLTQVKLTHLKGDERKQAVTAFANTSITNIESALADKQIDDPQWESNLLKEIQGLGSLVTEDESIGTNLDQFRSQIAELYIAKANDTLLSERFDAADGYVDVGERFAPGLQELLDMRNAVTSGREESERKARVAANKGDFKTFTEADNIAEAEKLFEQLKADIPETDNYIAFEAPQMLADSYARLAQSKAETKDYATAYSAVIKGLEIDPKNALLGSLKNEYQSEANIIELSELFKTAFSFPVDVRLKISQIENANPARYAEFSKASAKTLSDRINALRTSDENAAASLAQSAATLFPANAVLAELKNDLQLKPWEGLTAANASILAGKLTQATQLQQAAATEFTAHPDFITFSQTLEGKIKEANTVYDLYLSDKAAAGEDYQKLRSTKNLLARAQSQWTDSPDYSAAETELDDLIAKFKPVKKPKIRTAEKELTAESLAKADTGTGAATEAAPWKPIVSDSPCESRLAGYGKRAKAICFDMVHSSARGPLMVVVPNGEGFEKPFAIAKYEVSVSDWSKYCILSGTCQAIKDKDRKNEPMTGISLQQAQEYAAWLTERTGKTYRIPTKSEWEYAANAGGKQPKKDFNCRVSVGEKLIKGTGIVSVKSGKSNGWGLKNYVGNVQEWVIDGDTTTARGGAFTDAHSKCDISLERSHNGAADEATGFRLLREDVG
jgi:serine/threonine protein kinase